MAGRNFTGGLLYDLYASYVGEPNSRKDVYGYWLFLLGAVVSFIGVLVFLLGASDEFVVREVAISMAALGLPIGMFGILLLLPVKRQSIQIAGAGAAIALVGVGLFVFVYPRNWAIGSPDYSAHVITVYAVGTALVVGVAALVPVVTGEKSFFFEADYQRGGEYPPVEIGEALDGGLFAVFNDGDDWSWRFLKQDAFAGGTDGKLSHLETEERVGAVREMVAEAGIMEIKTAAFRLYETDDDSWRWLLVREDGSVVADSGESFADRSEAAASVNNLKDFGPGAELLEAGDATFDCYETGGAWRWQLLDAAGTTLAASPQAYDDEADAEAAIERARSPATEAETLEIEEYGVELLAEADDWYWRIIDEDETELARTTIGYDARTTAESAVYDVVGSLGNAPLIDGNEPGFEVTPTGTGQWRWRLVDDDDIIARNHAPAGSERAASNSALRFSAGATDAETVVVEDADFEYFRDGEDWYWRLVTDDRETIAETGSAYEDREGVAEAIEAVRTQAVEADLIEFETAAFQVYEAGGQWRWRLINEVGNVMADSGDAHESRDGAVSSMMTVKENAPEAELLEIETAAFELFEESDGWNWRLVDEMGETIARGVGSHGSKQAARTAMDRLVTHADARSRELDGPSFQLYTDEDDEWRWRFLTPDGTIIADGERTHSTRDETAFALDETVRGTATSAAVNVVEELAVELRESGTRWTWRVVGTDREPVATGESVYADREAATEAVTHLQAHVGEAPIFELDGPAFELTHRDDGWTWRLIDGDRTPLTTGPDPFASRGEATTVLDRVAELLPAATLLEIETAAFEIRERENEWYWQLVDEEGEVIASGTQGHPSREDAAASVAAIRTELDAASVLEVDTAAFELYESDGQWRWRLVDESGEALAESLQPHDSRREARETMEATKQFAPEAMIRVAE